jgi:hypothetical protein
MCPSLNRCTDAQEAPITGSKGHQLGSVVKAEPQSQRKVPEGSRQRPKQVWTRICRACSMQTTVVHLLVHSKLSKLGWCVSGALAVRVVPHTQGKKDALVHDGQDTLSVLSSVFFYCCKLQQQLHCRTADSLAHKAMRHHRANTNALHF